MDSLFREWQDSPGTGWAVLRRDTLYQKRKADARAGIMLPSNLRQRPFNIAELGQDAKQWFKDHDERDLRTFTGRMDLIITELGCRAANSLKPKEIDNWLSGHSEWSPATKNRYKTVLIE